MTLELEGKMSSKDNLGTIDNVTVDYILNNILAKLTFWDLKIKLVI